MAISFQGDALVCGVSAPHTPCRSTPGSPRGGRRSLHHASLDHPV